MNRLIGEWCLTGRNHHDRFAGQWALLALHGVHTSRNQDGKCGLACVTSTFTALSANDINTVCEGLLDMLQVVAVSM